MTAIGVRQRPILALSGVTKTFGDFVALDDVSLLLRAGQVHALLGANGSGKSTLVKVMCGVLQPEVGTLEFDGVRLASMGSPADAAARGVRVVHQEAPLIDTLSVAEAVAVFRGFGARQLGKIGWRRLRRDVQELLDQMDVQVSASQSCASLGPADRAGLALAIVVGDLFTGAEVLGTKSTENGCSRIARGESAHGYPKLLIVDEVTAAIHESETSRHLQRLRSLADAGLAVVMVTHRLSEVAIADDITVLRGGAVAYWENGGPRKSTNEIVALMVGENAASSQVAEVSTQPGSGPTGEPPSQAKTSTQVNRALAEAPAPEAIVPGRHRGLARRQPVRTLWQALPVQTNHHPTNAGPLAAAISVEDLTGDQLKGCAFAAVAGEIVGFAGLRTSGVEELPHILAGGARWMSGCIRIGGQLLVHAVSPGRMIGFGVTAIPSDRLRAGGVASLSVSENVILPALGKYWHRRALRDRVVRALIEAFDVRPADQRRLFGTLSGGNQQKVLLGKWLSLHPRVLVLDDPTYGVDPAARETIFDAMVDAAQHGVCELFFSTEPEQLVRVCNRVLVLRNGAIATELSGERLTLEQLIEWSYQ